MVIGFIAIIIFSWIIFLAYWFITGLQAKKNKNKSFTWMWILVRIIAGLLILFTLRSQIAAKMHEPYSPHVIDPVIGTLAALLTVIGIGFAIWARYHLGNNWGMPMSVKEKPNLITSGPYAYVRHPIYTGILVATIGSLLIAGVWWLIIFVCILAYFVYSARKEEDLMIQEFPDQYPSYTSKTKFLIPFLW